MCARSLASYRRKQLALTHEITRVEFIFWILFETHLGQSKACTRHKHSTQNCDKKPIRFNILFFSHCIEFSCCATRHRLFHQNLMAFFHLTLCLYCFSFRFCARAIFGPGMSWIQPMNVGFLVIRAQHLAHALSTHVLQHLAANWMHETEKDTLRRNWKLIGQRVAVTVLTTLRSRMPQIYKVIFTHERPLNLHI